MQSSSSSSSYYQWRRWTASRTRNAFERASSPDICNTGSSGIGERDRRAVWTVLFFSCCEYSFLFASSREVGYLIIFKAHLSSWITNLVDCWWESDSSARLRLAWSFFFFFSARSIWWLTEITTSLLYWVPACGVSDLASHLHFDRSSLPNCTLLWLHPNDRSAAVEMRRTASKLKLRFHSIYSSSLARFNAESVARIRWCSVQVYLSFSMSTHCAKRLLWTE